MTTLRLDRIVALYLFGPLQRCRARTERVPILMYHSISREEENRVHPYYRIRTTPEVFAQQMAFLGDHGYHTLDMQQMIRVLAGPSALTEKAVVLTFDDGFQDFHREAFPILERCGFTAMVYLPTAHIGNSSICFQGHKCLTWSEVRELHAEGITFGSHTVTHPQLRLLPRSEVERELDDSKAAIEDALGTAVTSFAYPYAFPQRDVNFCRFLRDALTTSGYCSGVCTIVGGASASNDGFFLPRLPVNSDDDSALFRTKLEGGYDWLGNVQAGVKSFKRMVTTQIGARSEGNASRLSSSL
jgi:peptidoglycan/xylan/chitin deacetylase (PgdA/CDA1 family)